jgi:hypothetical protein
MSRRGAWIVVGLLFLAGVTITMSSVVAQGWGQGPGPGNHPPGRFQVVSSSPEGVILLDTATGELYKAGPGDIKPYYMRPRVGQDFGRERERPTDKDFPRDAKDLPKDFRDLPRDFPKDLRPDSVKDLFKDRPGDRPPPRDFDKKDAGDKPPRDFDKKDADRKDFKDKEKE